MGVEDWLNKQDNAEEGPQKQKALAEPSAGGIISMFAVGAIGSGIIGGFYGFTCQGVRTLGLACVLAVLAGTMVGCSVAQGARLGGGGSKRARSWVGIFCGVLTVYANWVSWIWAISGHKALILRPDAIIRALHAIAGNGVLWVHGTVKMETEQQYFDWSAELIIIVFCSWLAARKAYTFGGAFNGIMHAIGIGQKKRT